MLAACELQLHHLKLKFIPQFTPQPNSSHFRRSCEHDTREAIDGNVSRLWIGLNC